MGHVVMGAQLAGLPEKRVYAFGEARGDPMREAVFSFARKVARDPATVRKADVDALRPHLKDAQIVELTLAICRYGTMNRMADAFGVALERENVFAPPEGKGEVRN